MNNPRHSESFKTDPIPTLRRYWSDPAFAAEIDADQQARQDEINRRMDEAIRRKQGNRR